MNTVSIRKILGNFKEAVVSKKVYVRGSNLRSLVTKEAVCTADTTWPHTPCIAMYATISNRRNGVDDIIGNNSLFIVEKSAKRPSFKKGICQGLEPALTVRN